MTGVQFRVAGVAKPRKDWQDKERQATTRDGRPLWTVRLIAFDSGAGPNGSSRSGTSRTWAARTGSRLRQRLLERP